METEVAQVGNQKFRFALYAILFCCLPFIIIVYLLFSLFTIPATIIIWHFYKQQIKQHAIEQYDEANKLVKLIKNDYCVPIQELFQTILHSPKDTIIQLFQNSKELLLEQIWGVVSYLAKLFDKTLEKLLEIPQVQQVVQVLAPYWEIVSGFTNKILEFLSAVIEKIKYGYGFSLNKVHQLSSLLGIEAFIETARLRIVQIPNTQINIIGYAILNESGKSIQNLPPQQELNRFRIQLHQHSITQFWKVKDFKDYEILELECGDAAGLQYIAKNYHPKRCLGIDSTETQIQANIKEYNETDNLKFEYKNVAEVGTASKPETFDIILGLDLSKKPNFQNVDMKSYLKIAATLLKENGYLIIGDYDTQENIQSLQNILQSIRLAMVEKSDITVGVTQAIKLQDKYVKQHIQQNGNFIARQYAKQFMKPNEKLMQEFKSRRKIYVVYVLKKATL